ncbi:hypothetical protein ACFO3O_01125 [Dokdonia ponticola]|uniref:Uncharacterized protein n=1 Tax=Dokdonia ponticola TaxID=2041041 RepID=A0ABV9HTC1_9FLAO
MFWKKGNTKNTKGKIELNSNGFQVTHNNGVSLVEWNLIDKITAYKVDLITIDEICFEIEHLNKSLLITEECVGWRVFLKELLEKFPLIDKEWEEKIVQPPFERNETELYIRNKNVA